MTDPESYGVPARRTLLWLCVVALLAAALAVLGMHVAVTPAVAAGPYVWLGLVGSTLTAVLAALAAFQLCVPERGSAWVLLPLPAVILWLGATGVGCLELPGGPETWGETLGEAGRCLAFLLAISLPLGTLIVYMLSRARPWRAGRTLALGGLASAGAAASLLGLVHPHDAPLLDLGAHAFAIVVVMALSALSGPAKPAASRGLSGR